jgi:hypothetical protein
MDGDTGVPSPHPVLHCSLLRSSVPSPGNYIWSPVSLRLAVYNARTLIVPYGGVVVKFKPLLDRWKKDAAPVRTAKEYAIRLDLDDASRLHALAELFSGQPIEVIVTDLLHAGLDEIAAAMPYERGPKVISRDDQGDPLYEDIGLTPRFVELTRKFKKQLEASG